MSYWEFIYYRYTQAQDVAFTPRLGKQRIYAQTVMLVLSNPTFYVYIRSILAPTYVIIDDSDI